MEYHVTAKPLSFLDLFFSRPCGLPAKAAKSWEINSVRLAEPVARVRHPMAQIIRLEKDIFVAPQLNEADFAEIAARGFASVVNNRPDGEVPGQLPNVQAAAAAYRHGLEFRYLPVRNPNVTDDDVVDAFAALMNGLPGPILFYCRSGTRCATLWAQVAVERLGVARTLQIAAEAGYDLEVLRDRLNARARAADSAATTHSPQLLRA
jgi:sulfide:quinone oxidoreductase